VDHNTNFVAQFRMFFREQITDHRFTLARA
jgi:hypothetical protein